MTPTSSVAAVQVTSTPLDDVAVTANVPGALGAEVSEPPDPPSAVLISAAICEAESTPL